MLYIALPDKQVRRLSFYLAMEEYVARQVEADDCFFMWQVEPTVIFGRNQQMENEVNIAYCQQHGIQVVQRKSGGGCVYADMDNIMLSYISSETHVGQSSTVSSTCYCSFSGRWVLRLSEPLITTS